MTKMDIVIDNGVNTKWGTVDMRDVAVMLNMSVDSIPEGAELHIIDHYWGEGDQRYSATLRVPYGWIPRAKMDVLFERFQEVIGSE